MNKDKKKKSFEEDIGEKASWIKKWRKKGILWESVIIVGAIGWMVALPMVLGGYLGGYLDKTAKTDMGGTSWTISLIVLGLFIALYSVWKVFIYKK